MGLSIQYGISHKYNLTQSKCRYFHSKHNFSFGWMRFCQCSTKLPNFGTVAMIEPKFGGWAGRVSLIWLYGHGLKNVMCNPFPTSSNTRIVHSIVQHLIKISHRFPFFSVSLLESFQNVPDSPRCARFCCEEWSESTDWLGVRPMAHPPHLPLQFPVWLPPPPPPAWNLDSLLHCLEGTCSLIPFTTFALTWQMQLMKICKQWKAKW